MVINRSASDVLLFVKISINIESGEQKTILKKVMAAM
jgi:hypothetical protein